MAKYEIERKFLLKEDAGDDFVRMAVDSTRMLQGYLSRRKESTVRVRIAGDKAWLTVKGITMGNVREEYEYPVPVDDAVRMMEMCEGGVVEKTRYIVPWKGLVWEIDRFSGKHEGLILCEVELPEADFEVSLPPFVGREVTGNPQYYNSNL